jgi:hypothetical protein
MQAADLPDYASSDTVCVGISAAYSSTNNPRNIEKLWYHPYTSAFSDLVQPHGGRLLVYPTYPMWLPELVKEELKLREKFQKARLDFDDNQTAEQLIAALPESDVIEPEVLQDDGPRRSHRIAKHNRLKREDQEVLIHRLLAEREKLSEGKRKSSQPGRWPRPSHD